MYMRMLWYHILNRSHIDHVSGGKIMSFRKLSSFVLAAALLFSGCGKSEKKEGKEAQASTPTAEPTPTPTPVQQYIDEEARKEQANDFAGELRDYPVGVHTYSIPFMWEYNEPYAYPELATGNGIAMVYGMSGEAAGVTDKELAAGKDDFLEGYTSSLEDVEIISCEETDIQGHTMMKAKLRTTISNITGYMYVYWYVDDPGKTIGVMAFFQGIDTVKDYYNDFEAIMNSIR